MKIGTIIRYHLPGGTWIETNTTSKIYKKNGYKVIDIYGHPGVKMSFIEEKTIKYLDKMPVREVF